MRASLIRLGKLGILAATVGLAMPTQHPVPFFAYHDGAVIQFSPAPAATRATAALGPWIFGQRLMEDKPLDKRLNLYVVIPGSQHQSPLNPEFDHNLIVNVLTHDKPHEWDIYWCFKLDSSLTDDIRSEHQLLEAAQHFFKPADLFDVEDVPSREALAEIAGVRALADLKRFRRKDHSLPRLLIIPAHLAVSGTTEVEVKAEMK